MQGTKIIVANKTGNKTVQQKDISWSNLIRGKDALAHMKTKIIIELFSPIVIPYNNPSKSGSVKIELINNSAGPAATGVLCIK